MNTHDQRNSCLPTTHVDNLNAKNEVIFRNYQFNIHYFKQWFAILEIKNPFV